MQSGSSLRRPPKRQSAGWLAGVLALVAVLPYFGVWQFDYVTFDDPRYVYENHDVLAGLTIESVRWAFTTGHASNWHPLTWISHLLDVSWFGANAGPHHAVNVAFHAANTLLLFLFLLRATGHTGRAAWVAALFAAHPLHVESVAWISERKDLLSTFFLFLALNAYRRYVDNPSWHRYLYVAVAMALGLMSKPMLVTLPFLLLLLDIWPLNRLPTDPFDPKRAGRLLLEKLPLLALAATSSVITVLVQRAGGAVASLETAPMGLRVANALVSYVEYLYRMLFPANLAVLYPYPNSIAWWQWTLAILLLVAASIATVRLLKSRPFLAVGWFWYLGMLVPVIGLVQVGTQALADRYTYVPLVGIFIMLSWGGYDLLGRSRSGALSLRATAVLLVMASMTATAIQSRYWRDGETLWKRALDVTYENYRAESAYGALLSEAGKYPEALQHFQAAIRIEPSFDEAYNRAGQALAEMGKNEQALEHYDRALSIRPDNVEALNNRGNAQAALNRPAEALENYHAALRLKPGYAKALNGLGSALDDLGRYQEAIEQYRQAIESDPEDPAAYNNLGISLYRLGLNDEAIEAARRALTLEPGHSTYRYHLAVFLIGARRFDEARSELERVLASDPGFELARQALKTLPL